MYAIWLRNLETVVRKVNNRKSLVTSMKALTAILLENVELFRSEEYPKKDFYPWINCLDSYINQVSSI